MRVKQQSGICTFCAKTFGNAAMTRHLPMCPARVQAMQKEHSAGRLQKVFHIRASAGPYWAHIEAAGSARLSDLDGFLRKLWLECCGHLSKFTIGDVDYDDEREDDFGWGKVHGTMDASLMKVLRSGLKFSHEYDFGTTTYLTLKVIAENKGNPRENIRLMARNNPPEFACAKCKKPAEEVCSGCLWEEGEKAFFCEKCGETHECGEEDFSPVVNSPRMGMCGYTG